MAISPTAEGFRAAFRRPSLTFAEITWRWATGATVAAVFFFGLFEYLNTLPVSNGELLFLRTRQPYLVGEALAHIFRGSLSRGMMALLLAAIMLGVLWMFAAAAGRIATVRGLQDYFATRRKMVVDASASDVSDIGEAQVRRSSLRGLVRLNFLRLAAALAAIFGLVGAAILAGFASPDASPRPGIAFMLFLPLAGLIFLAWSSLNWLLSLAGMFAVRDGEDAVGAISAAVSFFRERTGAVCAVSTWTGLAHMVAFVGATTVVSVPLGFATIVPWRLIFAAVTLLTLVYFALADWLYMARLAGYVCIAEMPEALLTALPPVPAPPSTTPLAPGPPIETAVDRNEVILSDVPNLAVET